MTDDEKIVLAAYPDAYVTNYMCIPDVFYVYGFGLNSIAKTPELSWRRAADIISLTMMEKLMA